MIDLTFGLVMIVVLFVIFLILRSVISLKVCALCSAVVMMWLVLLVLLFSGTYVDRVLLGLWLGGSIVGSLYLLETKLPSIYLIFKLPYYLTLVVVAYALLGGPVELVDQLILLGLWLVGGIFYVGRSNSKLSLGVKKLIECCKNW